MPEQVGGVTMSYPLVSVARTQDRERVVSALVLAFADDPAARCPGLEAVGNIQVEDSPPIIPMIRHSLR